MQDSHIVRTLNLTAGEVLTLEKADDRMEFEALPLLLLAGDCTFDCTCKSGTNCGCNDHTSCSDCSSDRPLPCPSDNVG
jgi:hypothetical protein